MDSLMVYSLSRVGNVGSKFLLELLLIDNEKDYLISY